MNRTVYTGYTFGLKSQYVLFFSFTWAFFIPLTLSKLAFKCKEIHLKIHYTDIWETFVKAKHYITICWSFKNSKNADYTKGLKDVYVIYCSDIYRKKNYFQLKRLWSNPVFYTESRTYLSNSFTNILEYPLPAPKMSLSNLVKLINGTKSTSLETY